MDELSDLIKKLDITITPEESIEYEHRTVFKNKSHLPINQIHLEKRTTVLKNHSKLDKFNGDPKQYFEEKTVILPALDKIWLPEFQVYFTYEPYNFTLTPEENLQYLRQNKLFLQTLNYLLSCNYHQFWCSVLFEPQIRLALHSFLLNPILPHQISCLDPEFLSLYLVIYSQFLHVYRRLITWQESDTEYMFEETCLKYLLDKKLLNLPIVVTFVLLYQDLEPKCVSRLVELYFGGQSLFRDKEVEEMINQTVMVFEMIGGYICGFEPDAVIVPIAIEERPAIFSLGWVYSVVDYLLNTIISLNLLLKSHQPAVDVAFEKNIPFRLSFTYEKVFYHLYEMLSDRRELEENPKLTELTLTEIALARSEFIDVFNHFATHCLDKVLQRSGNPSEQEEIVEVYLKLLTSALEDEYFICDYNERYPVKLQNEMFASCTNLDETRTDYILSCINNFRRHNRIWKVLNCDKITLQKAVAKYAPVSGVKKKEPDSPVKSEAGPSRPQEEIFSIPQEEELEERIQVIIDMFPHLGDGFVLKCLEAYNYQVDAVISAILEENLPPHIVDIPFDQIRIPPEPKPAEPILAYRGKKPEYNDALALLNDKTDHKAIKTYILDGIQYSNEFDQYDDEFDDRINDGAVRVADQGSEDILRFNPNYDDAVSDTSYSETEYDEQGKPTEPNKKDERSRNGANFCEDPAAIRARREAKRRGNQGGAQGTSRDVVGKPKGQGQENNVVQNRQKKGVNKSSRANHNRKSGAQWKRNKGMVPS